ncbi:MAG: RsmD family RNA methyltransferase [Ahniella sp.]|nr:RsmD family RNA methyltransferase [Ahniella sp.]
MGTSAISYRSIVQRQPGANLKSKPHHVRIIGGSLRGSRVEVLDRPGLRPTPDRARETLFNWLAPVLSGARVLDLFAGTGVLGIEALSRGAGRVDFVESDPAIAAAASHADPTEATIRGTGPPGARRSGAVAGSVRSGVC